MGKFSEVRSNGGLMHLIHSKYRADIDGLRALAVLSVVGYHAFPNWIMGGFIGVDIFFVISGFLISTIIFSSLEHDRFSFVEFYNRRIKRIFPALIIVLVSGYAIGWFNLLPNEFKQLGKHIAAGAGFSSNFILWNESGYFDNVAETKPLLHLWSLAIEEQFYIFWPLLLAFVWKRKWSFLHITTIIAVVSFAANIYLISKDQTAAFYWPISRFWELMTGGFLAYIVLNKPELNNNYKNIQSAVGAALLALSLIYINRYCKFPGWWALLPTVGTFFIISAGPTAWINNKCLSNKILVWFGIISYPLYLWHWSLLSFVRIVKGTVPTVEMRAATIFISIILAWITYILIEKPLRFGKNSNVKSLILLIFMVILVSVGYNCYKKDGYVHRQFSDVSTFNINAFEWPKEKMKSQACDDRLKIDDMDFCLMSADKEPTVALIGDSHANAIYDAVNFDVMRKGGGLIDLPPEN